eukprot:3916541-Rhodomonas_salina.1
MALQNDTRKHQPKRKKEKKGKKAEESKQASKQSAEAEPHRVLEAKHGFPALLAEVVERERALELERASRVDRHRRLLHGLRQHRTAQSARAAHRDGTLPPHLNPLCCPTSAS